MASYKLVDFKTLGDERGSLIAIEEGYNAPFEIKRVYYIFGTKAGVSRGFHAHMNLKQIAICLSGSCKFHLNNGRETKEVLLDKSDQGLLIEGMVWREMYDFSLDCVLLVIASEHYNNDDYIRDYDRFLSMVVK